MKVAARIKKLKLHELGNAHKHNKRIDYAPNVDPTGKHFSAYERYEDATSLRDAVMKRVEEIPESQRTKIVERGQNATTVAVEIMISASPEYFRENADDYGKFDPKKTKAWILANRDFLKKEYGDNLLSIDVHLDEKTPHLHAMVTPIVVKNKSRRRTKEQIKNNIKADKYKVQTFDAAKQFNRSGLIRFQDKAAAAVKHLGINRGVRNIKLKNQSMKEVYSDVEKALAEAKALSKDDVPKIELSDKPTFESFSKYQEREEPRLNKLMNVVREKLKQAYVTIKELSAQLDRERTRVERFANFFNQDADDLEKKMNEVEQTISALENDSDSFKSKLQHEKLAHKFTQEDLDKANEKIEMLEQMTPEDRMLYKLHKAKGSSSDLSYS